MENSIRFFEIIRKSILVIHLLECRNGSLCYININNVQLYLIQRVFYYWMEKSAAKSYVDHKLRQKKKKKRIPDSINGEGDIFHIFPLLSSPLFIGQTLVFYCASAHCFVGYIMFPLLGNFSFFSWACQFFLTRSFNVFPFFSSWVCHAILCILDSIYLIAEQDEKIIVRL